MLENILQLKRVEILSKEELQNDVNRYCVSGATCRGTYTAVITE